MSEVLVLVLPVTGHSSRSQRAAYLADHLVRMRQHQLPGNLDHRIAHFVQQRQARAVSRVIGYGSAAQFDDERARMTGVLDDEGTDLAMTSEMMRPQAFRSQQLRERFIR